MVGSKNRMFRTPGGKIVTTQDAVKAGIITQDQLPKTGAEAAQLANRLDVRDIERLTEATSERVGFKVSDKTLKAANLTGGDKPSSTNKFSDKDFVAGAQLLQGLSARGGEFASINRTASKEAKKARLSMKSISREERSKLRDLTEKYLVRQGKGGYKPLTEDELKKLPSSVKTQVMGILSRAKINSKQLYKDKVASIRPRMNNAVQVSKERIADKSWFEPSYSGSKPKATFTKANREKISKMIDQVAGKTFKTNSKSETQKFLGAKVRVMEFNGYYDGMPRVNIFSRGEFSQMGLQNVVGLVKSGLLTEVK